MTGDHAQNAGKDAAEQEPYEYAPDDLKMLQHLSERVVNDSEWAGRRLVVEVWDKGDQGPIAWVEFYPGDSEPVIRFTRPLSPATPGGSDE